MAEQLYWCDSCRGVTYESSVCGHCGALARELTEELGRALIADMEYERTHKHTLAGVRLHICPECHKPGKKTPYLYAQPRGGLLQQHPGNSTSIGVNIYDCGCF